MEAARSFEKLLSNSNPTRHHNTGDIDWNWNYYPALINRLTEINTLGD